MTSSYTNALQSEYTRRDQADKPYRESVTLNDRYRAANAAQAGADWKVLANLSTTLTNTLVKQQEKKNKEDYLEYVNKGFDDGFEDSLVQEHNNKVEQIEEDRDYYQMLANDSFRMGEVSFSEKEEIENLSGWKAYGYAVGKAQSASERFGNYLDISLQDTDLVLRIGDEDFKPSEATTLPEKRKALRALRDKYLEEEGFIGMNPLILNEHLFPKMREAEQKKMNAFRRQYSIDQSLIRQQELFSEFNATKDLNALLEGLETTVNNNNQPLGMAGAWTMVESHLEKMFKANTLTEVDLDNIASQTPTHGKGKTYEQMFKTRVALWRLKRTAGQSQALNTTLDGQKSASKELEIKFTEEAMKLAQQDIRFTDEQLDELEATHFKLTGLPRPQFLDDYKTAEEFDHDETIKYLEKKREERGFLTEADVAIYSPKVKNHFKAAITEDQNLREIPEIENTEDLIGKYAAEALEETSGAKDKSSTWFNGKANAISDYKKLYRDAVKKGLPFKAAHDEAIQEVEKNFGRTPGQLEPGQRYDSKYFKRNQYSINETEITLISDTNRKIDKDRNYLKNTVIPNSEYALDIAAKWYNNQIGAELPNLYKTLGYHAGMDPAAIAVYQLNASGRIKANMPKVVEEVQANEALDRLLNFKRTPNSIQQAKIIADESENNGKGFDGNLHQTLNQELTHNE